jgi:hypothetical protein
MAMDTMNDAAIQDLNEEDDKKEAEMDENQENPPKEKERVLSEYQKKMRDQRAKRFGV